MKKKIVSVVLFLLAFAVITSCATISVVTKSSGVDFMDPNLLPAEHVVLTPTWGGIIQILTLNGTPLVDHANMQNMISEPSNGGISCLVFPPGKQTMKVVFSDFTNGSTKEFNIDYDFTEPGFYILTAEVEGGQDMVNKGKFVAKVGGNANTAKINVEKDTDSERIEKIKEQMRKNKMDI